MTSHEKRRFTQISKERESNLFDECVRLYLLLLRGFPIGEVVKIVRYEWSMAREYGIPESDICPFLIGRSKIYFRNRRLIPQPSTFTLG